MSKESVKQHAERIDRMIEQYRKRIYENRWGVVNKILDKYSKILPTDAPHPFNQNT